MPEGLNVCAHSVRDRTPAEAAEAAVQRGLQFQRDLDIRAAITAFEVRLPAIPCVICLGHMVPAANASLRDAFSAVHCKRRQLKVVHFDGPANAGILP